MQRIIAIVVIGLGAILIISLAAGEIISIQSINQLKSLRPNVIVVEPTAIPTSTPSATLIPTKTVKKVLK